MQVFFKLLSFFAETHFRLCSLGCGAV